VDGIIVHCSAAEESVVQRYALPSKEKTHVVPHGHYDDSYEDTLSQRQARDRLDIDHDVTTFLYLGRIRPYKQVPRLVEEFAGMPETDIRLVVAGNPTDMAEVREMESICRTDDRITTTFEFIPDEDMQMYLNAADAIVLPYRDVLTSGSAILGMTFRKPIIGPMVGCLPELLNEQPDLLYDPDEDSLADAMRRAKTADLDAIGNQNRRRILEFDWADIASTTENVYSNS
jgi:beta-1,4-mannosyltransferase